MLSESNAENVNQFLKDFDGVLKNDRLRDFSKFSIEGVTRQPKPSNGDELSPNADFFF